MAVLPQTALEGALVHKKAKRKPKTQFSHIVKHKRNHQQKSDRVRRYVKQGACRTGPVCRFSHELGNGQKAEALQLEVEPFREGGARRWWCTSHDYRTHPFQYNSFGRHWRTMYSSFSSTLMKSYSGMPQLPTLTMKLAGGITRAALLTRLGALMKRWYDGQCVDTHLLASSSVEFDKQIGDAQPVGQRHVLKDSHVWIGKCWQSEGRWGKLLPIRKQLIEHGMS